MKRYILFLFYSILFSGFSGNAEGQCPTLNTYMMPGSTVSMSGSNATFCPGDSVQIIASPGSGVTYAWYRNNLLIPEATRGRFWAKEMGSYTVVVNGSGCTTPSAPVTVNYKVQPQFNIVSDRTPPHICAQESIVVSVEPSLNSSWIWFSPAAVQGNANIRTLAAQQLYSTTTFIVIGQDNTSQCTNSSSLIVLVDDIIDGGLIQSDQSICSGTAPNTLTSVSLPTGGGGPGTYTWDWEESTAGENGPWSTITGANQPDYSPGTLTQTTWFIRNANSPPCSRGRSNPVEITVNQMPTVTSAASKAICSGTGVEYQPVSMVEGTTFSWTAVTSGSVTGITPVGNGFIGDLLMLPSGSTASGTATYTITPTGPAPTYCKGIPFTLVVTINPTPTVTNATLVQEICAGATTTAVALNSNVALATYSWTASASSGLAGYQNTGTGNIPAMQLFSPLLVPGFVTYTIIPRSPDGCDGLPVDYVITVKPAPSVINTPMNQTICSGGTTSEVILDSNKPNPVFSWNATANLTGISGYTATGTNTIPVQTIANSATTRGVVTYTINMEGDFAGCYSSPIDYKVYVNPVPVAIATPLSESICSGEFTNIVLSSLVTNTTFSWTASAPGSLTGFSNSDGLTIAQTITNTSIEPQNVTYTITPSSSGCTGPPVTVVITVWPAPGLTTNPLTQSLCSGSSTAINLTGTPSNATFSWTATGSGVSGYRNGEGTAITQSLINNTNSPSGVAYTITTSANGCTSVPVNYSVVVNPIPAMSNSPPFSSICSGNVFNLPLTSSVAGTTFSWTATGSAGLSGFSANNGSSIIQTLSNSTNATGTVIYTITPTANDCSGSPVTYTVTVNPIPDVTLSIGNQSVCSGISTAQVTFSTNVPGTTFSWSATPSNAGISGYTESGSAVIPSQFINSTLPTQGTVTYAVTPDFGGCTSVNKIHVVAVNPLPVPVITGSSENCAGSAGNIFSTQPGMTNYQWIVSGDRIIAGGGTPTSPEITVTWNTAGNPSVIVNYTDANGCTALAPAIKDISVKPIPFGSGVISLPSLCSEQPFTITLNSSVGSTTTYAWSISPTSLSGRLSGTSNPISESYVNIGTIPETAHFVIIPTNNGCQGLPFTADVTVNPLPVITISGNANTSIGATEVYTTQPGMTEYTWAFYPPVSGTVISGGTTNAVTVRWASAGQLCVNYKNAYGCNASEVKCVNVNASAVPATFDVTPTEGTFCEGATEPEGVIVGLSGAQGSIRYDLTGNTGVIWDTKTPVSSGAFNFNRPVNIAGIYRVKATNLLSGIQVWMNLQAVITESRYPIHAISSFNLHFCAGDHNIGISGSETDVKYWLMVDGILPDTNLVDGIHGTGLPDLDFGNPSSAGAYRIYASRNGSGCAVVLPGTNWIEPLPRQFNFMPAGEFCADEVGDYWLSASQPGFKYELHNKTADLYYGSFIGSPAGDRISLGMISDPGVYEVIATDIVNTASTLCQSVMKNNVIIHANPSQNHMMSPQGPQCEGVDVNIQSSEVGIWYHLFRMQNSTTPFSPPFASKPGTGSAINFGTPAESGLYRILAVNRWSVSDSCEVWLPGSIDLCKRPLVKDISPFGQVCLTSEIRVLNHEPDVIYQLIKDGNRSSPYQTITAGLTPVIFTPEGTPNFEHGTYSVRAVSSCNPNSCDRIMNGIVVVDAYPVVDAGVDESLCLEPFKPINIAGTALNYDTSPAMIQWVDLTSSGTFADPHSLITTYTPDSAPGIRELQLTVHGNNGCDAVTVSDIKVVEVFMLPTVNAGPDQMICQNTMATLEGVTGGRAASSIWTTSGSGSFSDRNKLDAIYTPGASDITAGTVTLTLTTTDGGRCADVSDDMNLIIYPTPLLTSTLAPPDICSGTTFSYSPSGITAGTIFAWSRTTVPGITPAGASGNGNPDEILTNSTTNPINVTYIYTLTANNCPNPATYNVVVIVNPGIGTYGPYCISDSPVTLTVTSEGGTFSGPGVQGNIFNPADAGIGFHTISYTSPSGFCPVSPFTINVVSTPMVKTLNQLLESCNGTTDLTLPAVTAGSSEGLYFTYFNDKSAIYPVVNPQAVAAGTYYIRGATMSGKCFDIQPVTVAQPDTLKVIFTSVSPACIGSANGSITATVTNGTAPYTYRWDTNPVQTNSRITDLRAGSYTLTVTDANMCTVTLTETLKDQPNIRIYIAHKDIQCMNDINGSARVDSINGSSKPSDLNLFTYKWNTTPHQTTREAVRLSHGYYTVTLTDANGCGIKDSVLINVLDSIPPTIECRKDTITIVLQSDGRNLSSTSPASTFAVDLGLPAAYDNCGVASLTNDAPEKYRLGITEVYWTVTDISGFTATCSQFVYIKYLPFVPKLISPNGDGINDYLEIDGLNVFPKSQLYIYTRSGQLVFSSEDYKNEWDGRFQTAKGSPNKIVAPGVYYYILNLGGITQQLKGFVYVSY